uniref:Uncharacterized protein n=1 Tax=Solanum tuberosum TaxID=4113 RepID=M1DMK4_SOLTU
MTKKDMINRSTLAEYSSLPDDNLASELAHRANGPVSQFLADLNVARSQNGLLQSEIGYLRAALVLSQREVAKLNDQFLHEQQESNANVDTLVQFLTPSMPHLFLTLALPLNPFTFSSFCCF